MWSPAGGPRHFGREGDEGTHMCVLKESDRKNFMPSSRHDKSVEHPTHRGPCGRASPLVRPCDSATPVARSHCREGGRLKSAPATQVRDQHHEVLQPLGKVLGLDRLPTRRKMRTDGGVRIPCAGRPSGADASPSTGRGSNRRCPAPMKNQPDTSKSKKNLMPSYLMRGMCRVVC